MRARYQSVTPVLLVVACGGASPGTAPGMSLPDARLDGPPPMIASVTALDTTGRVVTQVRQGGMARLQVQGTLLGDITGARLEGATTLGLTVVSRVDDTVELSGAVPHGVSLGVEDLILDAGNSLLRAPGALTITAITIGSGAVDAPGTSEAPMDVGAGLAAAGAGDRVVVLAGDYSLTGTADLALPDGVTLQGAGPGTTTLACNHLTVDGSAQLIGVRFRSQAPEGNLSGDHVHALTLRDVTLGAISLTTQDADAHVVLENVVSGNVTITGGSAVARLHLAVNRLQPVAVTLTDVDATISGLQVPGTSTPLTVVGGSLVLRRSMLMAFQTGFIIRGEPTAVDLGRHSDPGDVSIQLTGGGPGHVYVDDARPSRPAPDGVVVTLVGLQMGGQTLSSGDYTGPASGSFFIIEGTNQRMEF